MAKIPRINQGDRPSAVPTGAPANEYASVLPAIGAVGKMAEAGEAIAADFEMAEAARLRSVLEKKQAIVNEVEASRQVGDFEMDATDYLEKMKVEFADAPDKVPDQLLDAGRQLLDRRTEQTSNMEVGLETRRDGNARLMALVRQAQHWALGRQTQKTEGEMQIVINQTTAKAKNAGSPEALGALIAAEEVRLGPKFAKVYSPAEASSKMIELRQDMARSWALSRSKEDPIGVLRALRSTEKDHPFVKYLDVSKREAIENEALNSLEGRPKIRQVQAIVDGLQADTKIDKAFFSGDQEFAEISWARKRALENQRKSVEKSLEIDTAALKELGIDAAGHTDAEVLELIKERESYVQALEAVHRRQTPFDAPDDPTAAEAILTQTDKIISKTSTPKDMGEIIKQRARIAIALEKKTISGATAKKAFDRISLAINKADLNAQDVTGFNTWKLDMFRGPIAAGNVELNVQFKALGEGLSDDTRVKIRAKYYELMNEASEQGRNVSNEEARIMALRSAMMETEDPDMHRAFRKAGAR